jgi:hypothetical protein
MKPKKVITINPETREISEAIVSTLEEMQKLVGGLIERCAILDNGDELYANEEALFNSDLKPWGMIFESGLALQIVGPAYFIGEVNSRGNNSDVVSTVEDIKKIVIFQ